MMREQATGVVQMSPNPQTLGAIVVARKGGTAKSKPRKRVTYDLDLRDFGIVGPLLHKYAAGFYGVSASHCIRHNRPTGPVTLRISYDATQRACSLAVHRITKSIRASFKDLQDATEHGAYGVALLAASFHVGAHFAERSYKGPGYDFHLLPPGALPSEDLDDIFGDKWGLEVSGILKGGAAEVGERMRDKRKQVSEARKTQKTLVAIVEFSEPSATFEVQ